MQINCNKVCYCYTLSLPHYNSYYMNMQIRHSEHTLVSFQPSPVSYLLGQWPTKPNKDMKQKKLGF